MNQVKMNTVGLLESLDERLAQVYARSYHQPIGQSPVVRRRFTSQRLENFCRLRVS